MDLVLWIAVLVLMIGLELSTVQLVAIWLAASSLVTFFVALFGAEFWIQCVVFVVLTLILLIATRPLAKKLLGMPVIPTNADRNIGGKGVVLHKIDNENAEGKVAIDGLEWTARSADSTVIESGSTVIVERIEGVKLIVTKAQ
ncbi:MAG TPA: NfeD family protein [Oscillospiraceae bacterium]|nr:NfeD family protein [Oscillospiraceae bacterium]